jgi:general L-amino acid transport system permease protein
VVAVLTIGSLVLVQGSWWLFALLSAVMIASLAVAAWAPRYLLVATVLYPFATVWLLWGGSLWGPLLALAGIALIVPVYRVLSPRLGVVVATAGGVIVASAWWFLIQGYVSGGLQSFLPLNIASVDSDKFGGFLLAFLIGVSSISISLPIGILLALGRQSNMFLIRVLSVGFIEFVRGVPLITMLFTASLLLQYFLPPRVQFDLILRVVILVTLFSAAYNAEVVRGGLAALPKGQYEAAGALGLDYWQAQRLIIMPQALKVSIPGIVSTFIGLFKDTTLVSFVGLQDPLRGITAIVRADTDWKGIYWEPYIFVGAIFFVACYGMSRYSMYLERKLGTDHR